MPILSQGTCAVYEEPLGPEGVRIRTRPRTDPGGGQVSVAIKACSLNHLDIWVSRGAQRGRPPRVICADGAGEVELSETPLWKSGDRVVLYPVAACWGCDQCRAGQQVFCRGFGILGEHTDGTACELIHVPMENVFPVPDGISFEEAAAIPLTFLTAWRMLVTRARLLRGETLLVVGAGAGVGLAAVAIGRHLGARVLVTSRSPEKRSRALILGVNAALDSGRFSAQVKDATDGRGADVVFEHVGEATIDESLKSLGTGGRLVVCGATSGRTGCIDLPRLFFRQQTVYGSTMGNGTEFADVLEAVGEGMRPQVDRVFELGDIQAALRYLESGSQFGKVVLRVAE